MGQIQNYPVYFYVDAILKIEILYVKNYVNKVLSCSHELRCKQTSSILGMKSFKAEEEHEEQRGNFLDHNQTRL